MKRLYGLIIVVFAIGLFAVWFALPNHVSVAQDKNEQRISALETRVANLEVAVFGNATPAATPAATPVESRQPQSINGTTIEGSGTNLSESFDLAKGRYRVELTYTIASSSDFVGIKIVSSSGGSEMLFSSADATGQWSSSTLLSVESGTYLLEVQASHGTTWKVVFLLL